MRRSLLRPALFAAPFVVPLAGLLAAAPAAAQMLNGPMVPDAPTARPRAEPPALPGLAGRRAPSPIPAEPGQSLGPNEALFDAIDRGDLAAARDAMSRGADLNARNVLGLTPIDSAVDQNRSEIVFYLLSVRGPVIGGAAPVAEAPARRPSLAVPPAVQRAPRAPVAEVPARAAQPVWGGHDGPLPDRGFLGFDAGRGG